MLNGSDEGRNGVDGGDVRADCCDGVGRTDTGCFQCCYCCFEVVEETPLIVVECCSEVLVAVSEGKKEGEEGGFP